jgi:hypothetical protein
LRVPLEIRHNHRRPVQWARRFTASSMKRAMLLVGWIAGILVIGGSVLIAVMIFREGVTRPTVYELPSGYRGWLQIHYEDSSCPPAVVHAVFQRIRVGPDGRACTSGPLPTGWHYQRASYLQADGSRTAAPAVWSLGHSDRRKLVLVFVGTEQEFRTSQRPPVR